MVWLHRPGPSICRGGRRANAAACGGGLGERGAQQPAPMERSPAGAGAVAAVLLWSGELLHSALCFQIIRVMFTAMQDQGKTLLCACGNVGILTSWGKYFLWRL